MSDIGFLPGLFNILAHEFGIPSVFISQVANRWSNDGNKTFEEFAPYAFFCLKANFLWHLGLTNPQLFSPDKNDRKDLEYCHYLPNTEIFSSRDKKHRRLMPALIRPDQSFVDGDDLKTDLARLAAQWEGFTKEQRVAMNGKRGDAPPENDRSIIYKLWQKHAGEITYGNGRYEMYAFRDGVTIKVDGVVNGDEITIPNESNRQAALSATPQKNWTGLYGRIIWTTREQYTANGGTINVGTSAKGKHDLRFLEAVREEYQKAWGQDRNELIIAFARANLKQL